MSSTGKFKVGDRVRYRDEYCDGVGTVHATNGPDQWFVKVDPKDANRCPFNGGTTRLFGANNLELAAVAPQPQPPAKEPLRIEAGKFYLTRDGRKVGPMRRWSDEAIHRWEADDDDLSYIWADDGTEIDSDIDDSADLVAEWTEPQSTKEILDELEAWVAEQDAIKAAGKGIARGSTAGFTVPLCALEAEPDLTAIGKAYADGYAAGLRAAA